MNPLRYLEKRIRGWLPKKPHSSGCQRITNHKSTRIGRQIGIVAFIMGFAGGLLGAFGVSLGLFSGLGMYVLPILSAIALSIAVAVIMIQKKKTKNAKDEL
jgi:amino acid permease